MQITVQSAYINDKDKIKVNAYIEDFITKNFKDISFYKPLEITVVDSVINKQNELYNIDVSQTKNTIAGFYTFLNGKNSVFLDSYLFSMFSSNHIISELMELAADRDNSIYHEITHMIVAYENNTVTTHHIIKNNQDTNEKVCEKDIIQAFKELPVYFYEENITIFRSQKKYPIKMPDDLITTLNNKLKQKEPITPLLLRTIFDLVVYIAAIESAEGTKSIDSKLNSILLSCPIEYKDRIGLFHAINYNLNNNKISKEQYLQKLVNLLFVK